MHTTQMQGARLGRLALLAAAAFAAGVPAPIFAEGAPPTIDDAIIGGYRDRQAALAEESQRIISLADQEQREPTGEELNQVTANTNEIERLAGLIDVRARALAQAQSLSAPQGRQTTPTADPAAPQRAAAQAPAAPAFSAARDRGPGSVHNRNHGFGTFGEFANAVSRSILNKGETDQRLRNAAATTVASEGIGADGGFLVPPEYRERILSHVFDENDLLSRTDQQVMTRNSISFPVDQTTPWGTSGVRVYWESEAAAITQSRPVFGELTLKANKLAALVPVTEELLEDVPAMGNYLDRAAGRGMNYAIGNSIIDGTGAGQPLGFLRSSALVTVAAEGGQTADTVVAANVAKMYTRMPASSRASAIWLVNPDVEAQFILMTLGGTAAAMPVYMPPNGLSASPFGTILGRPAIPHLACKAIGDIGDINYVDLNQYVTAVKTGQMQAATSIHLWFDQHLAAFRFTMRVDGRPWPSQVITPPNGSSQLSPFVSLAAR